MGYAWLSVGCDAKLLFESFTPCLCNNSVKLEELDGFIREKIEKDKWTHNMLKNYLQQAYPGQKGFSIRSIRRYCSENDIHRTSRLDNDDLGVVVSDAI